MRIWAGWNFRKGQDKEGGASEEKETGVKACARSTVATA
jgi:hypothetical protein